MSTSELEVCLHRQFAVGRNRGENMGEHLSVLTRARTIKATIPTSSRGQLGGVVNRGKPLSTLMAIARGKDEQLVDFYGFYVVSRVLTWTDLWGE